MDARRRHQPAAERGLRHVPLGRLELGYINGTVRRPPNGGRTGLSFLDFIPRLSLSPGFDRGFSFGLRARRAGFARAVRGCSRACPVERQGACHPGNRASPAGGARGGPRTADCGPRRTSARRKVCIGLVPPIGGWDAPTIASSIQNNSGRPWDSPGALWQPKRCGEPTLEGEVQHEAARVHHAARRRGGGVAARSARRSRQVARPLKIANPLSEGVIFCREVSSTHD